MRFKKIVGFGDSFMWGDELVDPALSHIENVKPIHHLNTEYRERHCFLGQLGYHYSVPVENFGIPGGSLQSTLWNYIWWTRNTTDVINDCLILVALTTANRVSFYNPNHISYSNDPPWNKYVHGAWIRSGNQCYDQSWHQMYKQFLDLTDCKQLHEFNYLQSTMFFEGQSILHDNNLFQFNSLNSFVEISIKNLIWPNTSLYEILLQQPNSKELLAPNRHPNESGHKLIAQLLIDHID